MKLIKPYRIIQFIHIYQLYIKAFPIYERKPFSVIISKFKEGKTDIWYIEDNNQFIGLATTLNTGNWILFDYFAIHESKRNQGYGSKALQLLKEKYKTVHFIGEIESTLEDCVNIEERIKRKNFYLHNGMMDLHILVNVFGTPMELIAFDKDVTYEAYKNIYIDNYGKRGDKNISKL